jgi:hypothetical protein
VNVAGGCYEESVWEIPNGKTVIIKGDGKDTTFVTAGPQNYDSFIICNESLKIFIFIFYFFYLYL